jgi:hypothetical protein
MIYWKSSINENRVCHCDLKKDSSITDINIHFNFKTQISYMIGNEIDFIAVYEHETEEDFYILHQNIQNFSKFIICTDFLAVINWLKKLHPLIDFNLLTDSIMENNAED